MPPRLRRKLPSIKNSAEGREIRDQRANYPTAARVICTAVAAVMELCTHVLSTLLRAVCTIYVQYLQQQLKELRIHTYVVYSRTCGMYSSSSSCDGATHVLPTFLRTVYTKYVQVQYLQQQLWCHLSTQLRCGSSHHRRILPDFFSTKQNSIIVARKNSAFCGTHIPTLTLPPQHLLTSPSSTC